MRTVFTNDMLAHVFAQQTQSHGHSNRARFQGDTFYSYAQPVARILTARGKRKVLLVTSRTWSPTTSAHCSDVISACAFDYIRVPSLGHVPYSTSGKPDHAANLAFLTKAHRDNVEKLKRKRALWGSLIDSLGYTADPLNKYCVAFGYKFRLDIDADIAAIEAVRAARDARANTPAAIAKRERDKVRRAYDLAWREAIQDDYNRTNRMDAPARIAAWERGAIYPRCSASRIAGAWKRHAVQWSPSRMHGACLVPWHVAGRTKHRGNATASASRSVSSKWMPLTRTAT